MVSLAHLLGASVRGARREIMGLAWLHGLAYFQQAAGEVGEYREREVPVWALFMLAIL